jgi:hypothetical protein
VRSGLRSTGAALVAVIALSAGCSANCNANGLECTLDASPEPWGGSGVITYRCSGNQAVEYSTSCGIPGNPPLTSQVGAPVDCTILGGQCIEGFGCGVQCSEGACPLGTVCGEGGAEDAGVQCSPMPLPDAASDATVDAALDGGVDGIAGEAIEAASDATTDVSGE